MEPIRVKYTKHMVTGMSPTGSPIVGTISGIGDIVHFSVLPNGTTHAIIKCDGSGKFHECKLDDVIAIDYDISTKGF